MINYHALKNVVCNSRTVASAVVQTGSALLPNCGYIIGWLTDTHLVARSTRPLLIWGV